MWTYGPWASRGAHPEHPRSLSGVLSHFPGRTETCRPRSRRRVTHWLRGIFYMSRETGATSKGWVPGSPPWGLGQPVLHPASPEPSQEPLPESGSRWRQVPSGGSGLLTGPPTPLPVSCSYPAPTSCNPHSTLQNAMGKLRLGEWGDCPWPLPQNLGPFPPPRRASQCWVRGRNPASCFGHTTCSSRLFQD